jgi:hypothetical protein
MDVRCNISSSMPLHARTHAGFDAVPPAALENERKPPTHRSICLSDEPLAADEGESKEARLDGGASLRLRELRSAPSEKIDA